MMRTLLVVLVASLGAAACGDDSSAVDMATCQATTCTAAQFFNPKTCACDNRDMATATHD